MYGIPGTLLSNYIIFKLNKISVKHKNELFLASDWNVPTHVGVIVHSLYLRYLKKAGYKVVVFIFLSN
jgi:hypothetical protein